MISIDKLYHIQQPKVRIISVGMRYIVYSLILLVQYKPIVTGFTPMSITSLLPTNYYFPILCNTALWETYDSTIELQWEDIS